MNNSIIYNSDKFKAMIHYIISRCESGDNFALFKLLYFSDFDYYEKYEQPISGETYVRKTGCPVPSHFQKAIEELVGDGKIEECPNYQYSSLAEPDLSSLTLNEIQVIDDVIDGISHFKQSRHSHGDIPLRLANDGEPLIYEAVFYREPQYSVRDYAY
ncbi:Panacea domain-containing protein [uncultured Methanobrevibacter sp.]|uniref:Panacea domain-containing protein n=1 Tax=uncultured Methanobrevibacter sp. TaxID=253161 RepID=UPI00261E5E9F|nr:Panacea domain-containing protein [uncultured Methanobrevibacter sp.]